MAGQEAIRRSPDQHPVTLAGYVNIGVASALAIHATLWPQFREIDFALYLASIASFVIFSISYLVWVRCIRRSNPAHSSPGFPDGPTPPTVDATEPVPVGPRSPVMRWGEAKAQPVELVAAREMNPLPIAVTASPEPMDPETDKMHARCREAD